MENRTIGKTVGNTANSEYGGKAKVGTSLDQCLACIPVKQAGGVYPISVF